jgi:hypothetical protein
MSIHYFLPNLFRACQHHRVYTTVKRQTVGNSKYSQPLDCCSHTLLLMFNYITVGTTVLYYQILQFDLQSTPRPPLSRYNSASATGIPGTVQDSVHRPTVNTVWDSVLTQDPARHPTVKHCMGLRPSPHLELGSDSAAFSCTNSIQSWTECPS